MVDAERHGPDPILGSDITVADMIVGEVKEGPARLNPETHNPAVLQASLVRFGCCTAAEAPALVAELLQNGQGTTASGHRVRMVAFGSTLEDDPDRGRFTFILLGHVIAYLESHLREHWELVRMVQTKDPVLGLLLTLEKARRAMPNVALLPEPES